MCADCPLAWSKHCRPLDTIDDCPTRETYAAAVELAEREAL